MSSTYIKRTTLFKVAEENIDEVLQAYVVLRKDAVKDGKPYIVSNFATRIINTSSPLSEGFTISSQSIFKSREDNEFYDKECPAHKKLRETTGKYRVGNPGIMTVITEGEWPEAKL